MAVSDASTSELIAELARRADAAFPAVYYRDRHRLEANRLLVAHRRGQLRAEKRHGRWFYRLADVRELWPHKFLKG